MTQQRVEVTDEMVERFRSRSAHWDDGTPVTRGYAREMLQAALNPPPEPEIEVSEGMLTAGNNATNVVQQISPGHADFERNALWDATHAAVYRAMERQRRREEAAARDARLAARP